MTSISKTSSRIVLLGLDNTRALLHDQIYQSKGRHSVVDNFDILYHLAIIFGSFRAGSVVNPLNLP